MVFETWWIASGSAVLEHGYAVVATSREVSRKGTLIPSTNLMLVDNDVGDAKTASRAVDEAVAKFGELDLLVNNAGIFIVKPFTDYTNGNYATLISTNLVGFFHMTQGALRYMVPQRSGRVVNIAPRWQCNRLMACLALSR